MKEEIEQLQSKLNQHFRGILWISNDSLTKHPRPFHALNYFLNGLLLNSEKSHSLSEHKNLFCTRHFDKNFFLGHLDSSTCSLDTELVSLMSWTKTQLEEGDKVMVLDQSGKHVKNALVKKYPKLNFEEFSLE